MSHDQIAELRGYRAELAGAEANGRAEHAERVRPEIGRVRGDITARAGVLGGQADAAEAAGQHDLAAQLRGEVGRLRGGLDADTAAYEPPASRDAIQPAPPERAVTSRKGK